MGGVRGGDIYVLGAGFSFAFSPDCFPLTDYLVNEGMRRDKFPNEFKALRKFLESVRLENENINFEKLATFLFNDPNVPKSNKQAANPEEYLDLLGLIVSVLKVQKELLNLSLNHKTIKNWIKKLNDNFDTIISFNFDLILEQYLHDLGWDPLSGYCMDFILLDSESKYPKVFSDQKQLKYLKLHGSLNWLIDKDDSYDVSNKKIFFKKRDYHLCWDNTFQGFHRENVDHYPYIIPPLIGKKYENQATSKLWQISKSLIEKSKRIFLIGYSLPESDVIAEFMFRTSSPTNAEIKVIRPLGNEDKNALLKRFESIFDAKEKGNKVEVIEMDAMDFLRESLDPDYTERMEMPR